MFFYVRCWCLPCYVHVFFHGILCEILVCAMIYSWFFSLDFMCHGCSGSSYRAAAASPLPRLQPRRARPRLQPRASAARLLPRATTRRIRRNAGAAAAAVSADRRRRPLAAFGRCRAAAAASVLRRMVVSGTTRHASRSRLRHVRAAGGRPAGAGERPRGAAPRSP